MLGNYIKLLADEKGLSISDLTRILDCDENEMNSLIKGRRFLPFKQIAALSRELGVSVADLFNGNYEHYNATVVHCMNEFDDPKNREIILDIIDDYVDIIDAVSISK